MLTAISVTLPGPGPVALAPLPVTLCPTGGGAPWGGAPSAQARPWPLPSGPAVGAALPSGRARPEAEVIALVIMVPLGWGRRCRRCRELGERGGGRGWRAAGPRLGGRAGGRSGPRAGPG